MLLPTIYASLPAANLKRTANQIISAKLSLPVRRGQKTKLYLQNRFSLLAVGGDSIESSKGCSLPPAIPRKPQNAEALTAAILPPARVHTVLPLRRERRRLRRFFVRRKHFFLLGAWLRFLKMRGRLSRLCTAPRRMSEACD